MNVSSFRLDLTPLTAGELSLATYNFAGLEQALGLNVTGTTLDEELRYAMRIRLYKVLAEESNYLWLTHWAIVHREEQRVIGFLILKGSPNEQGEVIIGYIIDESYRRQGYATEAVSRMCGWIFQHPQALWVVADTEKDNTASHNVLRRLGAELYRETAELYWWRIPSPAAVQLEAR
ncbi:GNAT family N-acetyltransferase ['Paenibacillus yunnanensis' Narsing Rao et al. 2020]|uniref:GNAT family N-acetyltransferase n=1 Tax=Paenibacillus tengchongensis TaxID=2608684 RepID=UPI00124CF312|nr:GNAT family N-acetyltransferase [Paenibacillus tengchongensis]